MLIVDEVFVDMGVVLLFVLYVDCLGFVVLCLVGKFFGFVGICVGFVFVCLIQIVVLCDMFGVWIVGGFVCYVVVVVFVDCVW